MTSVSVALSVYMQRREIQVFLLNFFSNSKPVLRFLSLSCIVLLYGTVDAGCFLVNFRRYNFSNDIYVFCETIPNGHIFPNRRHFSDLVTWSVGHKSNYWVRTLICSVVTCMAAKCGSGPQWKSCSAPFPTARMDLLKNLYTKLAWTDSQMQSEMGFVLKG